MTLEPRLLTVKEAAAYAAVSVGQLRKHGPAHVQIGRCRRYDRVAVDRWIEGLGGVAAVGGAEGMNEAMKAFGYK